MSPKAFAIMFNKKGYFIFHALNGFIFLLLSYLVSSIHQIIAFRLGSKIELFWFFWGGVQRVISLFKFQFGEL